MALCCVKIQQPSNLCLFLSDLCTSSLCLMKLTRQTHSTAYRDQTQESDLQRQPNAPPRMNNSSWNYHTHRRRFSTPSSDLSHMRRQDGLVIPRSTWIENMVILQTYTHRRVFVSSPCAGTRLHAPKNRC